MKFSNLAMALLVLGAAACGKSGGDKGSASASVEANLDAENFSSTVDSDNAAMNQSDLEQLNSNGG